MKQMKKVDKIVPVSEMSEAEKLNEELYVKEVELKNRNEVIQNLDKKKRTILSTAARDLSRMELEIKEKDLVSKYGNDISKLNSIEEYRQFLTELCEFEKSVLRDRKAEICEKVEEFNKNVEKERETVTEEIELLKKSVSDLKSKGAVLSREIPETSYFNK